MSELAQQLGFQAFDESASVSAADLRSLMNRMQVRSEHVKARVRDCIASQRHQFGQVISQATTSLCNFSQIADDVEPLLVDPELSRLCSNLTDLAQKIQQEKKLAAEKQNALDVVSKISTVYLKLNSSKRKISQVTQLVDAAKELVDVGAELGMSSQIVDSEIVGYEDEIKPYAVLKQLWVDNFKQLSEKLEQLFHKSVVLDTSQSNLNISDRSRISIIFTAMEKVGLLGSTFSRFTDSLWKCILSSLIRNPLTVDFSEQHSEGEATLLWSTKSKLEESMPLASVYSKLLKLVNFIWLYICCSNEIWMKEFGRFLWPRIADAIISEYLSKAIPTELEEFAQFHHYASITNDFENGLSKFSIIPTGGDKLGRYASDVEFHFVSRKRDRILAKAQRLIGQADFNVFSRRQIGAADKNRVKLLFQLENCVVSSAAKQLIEMIHSVLEDTCVASSDMAVELYHTVRDVFLLYSANVPVKLAKELKSLSLEAVIFYNDCLYLGHESLALLYQYREAFPEEVKTTCVFVDLYPLFKDMADDTINQQINIIRSSLDQALDQADGFRNTNKPQAYEMATLAVEQIVFLLEKVRVIWQPVMIHNAYVKSMGLLLTSTFQRFVSEILEQDDIDVRETEQLRKLIFSLEDRLLPLLHSLRDEDTHVDAKAGATCEGSLHHIGRLVPMWCKLLRLAELLDMSLISITQAWERGNLSACGFSAFEVQKLIKAVFSDTDLRRDCLNRISASQT